MWNSRIPLGDRSPNSATPNSVDPGHPAEDFPPPDDLRPAFQIRQMGTLEKWRRQGCARDILELLEAGARTQWGCASGWLQARLPATTFYERMGWTAFGPTYEVEGIGPHVSMYKLCR